MNLEAAITRTGGARKKIAVHRSIPANLQKKKNPTVSLEPTQCFQDEDPVSLNEEKPKHDNPLNTGLIEQPSELVHQQPVVRVSERSDGSVRHCARSRPISFYARLKFILLGAVRDGNRGEAGGVENRHDNHYRLKRAEAYLLYNMPRAYVHIRVLTLEYLAHPRVNAPESLHRL